MARVLVTGGSGFVGSNLVRALVERGDEVTCLVRPRKSCRPSFPPEVKLVPFTGLNDVDAIDQAVAGQAVVFHAAGVTKVVRRERFFEVNAEGTRNLVQACARRDSPPVVVYVSSLAASGPSVDGRARVESDRAAPVSEYGRSKRAGELALREAADRVPITIVRPAIVLGQGDLQGLELFKPIKRLGLHVMPGSGRQRYSIIHVADLCDLLLLAARKGRRIVPSEADDTRSWGCYFAACDEQPTFAELGRLLADAIGRRRCLPVPVVPACVRVIAAMVQGVSNVVRRPFYLNPDKAKEIAAGSWLCSNAAAKDELGFAPAAPLAQRLAETAAWYRAEKWL